MPEILELAQLAQHDAVTEMQVRRGRVATEFDAERPTLFELGLQLGRRHDLLGAADEFVELCGRR